MDRKIAIEYNYNWFILKIPSDIGRLTLIFNYLKEIEKKDKFIKKTNEFDINLNKYVQYWIIKIKHHVFYDFFNYINDNRFNYVLKDVPLDVFKDLKNKYIENIKRIQELLKLMQEQIDIEKENYDYLKITPYYHQKKAIKFFEISDGKAILADQPGLGKALWEEEPVLLKNGEFKKIKDINPGDEIVDGLTRNAIVLKKYYSGKKRGYIVTFSDSTNILADSEHLWYVKVEDFIENEIILNTRELKYFIENNFAVFVRKLDGLYVEIIKIEEDVEEKEYYCILTDSIHHSFVTRNYIITHNTLPSIAYAYKNKFKTLIICPASLKLMWFNEIKKYVDAGVYIYNYSWNKSSVIKNDNPEKSLFYIINYDILERYLLLKYKHKCSGSIIDSKGKNKKCIFQAEDINEKYDFCPFCGAPSSKIKSKIIGYEVNTRRDYILDPKNFDLVIIDECHRMKNIKTKWTKIIHTSFKDISHKILLSGTLIKNRPIELFSSLSFIKPEEFGTYHYFGMKYCAGYKDKFGWRYDGVSNLMDLYKKMSSFVLRRRKEDTFDMPQKRYIYIPIMLDEKERHEYNEIFNQVVKIVKETEEKVRFTVIEKIHTLKKITGRSKSKYLIEIIEDILEEKEKIVVFTEYVEIAEYIHNMFSNKSVLFTGQMSDKEKYDAIEKFKKNNDIQIFVGTIIASGVGIDLSEATKLIKVGFSWTPADEEQAEDRIHRITSKSDYVDIITLYCTNTIDEDIMKLLENKRKTINIVLDGKEEVTNAEVLKLDIIDDLINVIKNS